MPPLQICLIPFFAVGRNGIVKDIAYDVFSLLAKVKRSSAYLREGDLGNDRYALLRHRYLDGYLLPVPFYGKRYRIAHPEVEHEFG